MRTTPRMLNEATVRQHNARHRRVTLNPAMSRLPGGIASIGACQTECDPCDSTCRQLCTQTCCHGSRDPRDCDVRTFIRNCCRPGQNCCAGRCVNFLSDESNWAAADTPARRACGAAAAPASTRRPIRTTAAAAARSAAAESARMERAPARRGSSPAAASASIRPMTHNIAAGAAPVPTRL
jgi:hypothetical protein